MHFFCLIVCVHNGKFVSLQCLKEKDYRIMFNESPSDDYQKL